MVPNNQLKLMIWNAQGIKNKIHEFFYFLQNNSIEISLVSETHLSSIVSCSHPEYLTYRLDRDDGHRAGGVAIFIKRSVKHKLHPCPQTETIEALGLEVFSGTKRFNIYSIYFPGSKNAQQTLKFTRDLNILSSGSNFLIGCDFNARNVAWNCLRNNSTGKALQQMIESDDLLIHYPDSPTHFPHNGNNPSTIDLMLSRGFPNPLDISTDIHFHLTMFP